jgi:putative membrane protein
MKRIFGLILTLLVLVFGLFFGLLNADPVTVNYYFGTSTLPLSLILVFSLLLGAVCGVLAALSHIFRLRRELNRLRREQRRTDEELSRLRALPADETSAATQ